MMILIVCILFWAIGVVSISTTVGTRKSYTMTSLNSTLNSTMPSLENLANFTRVYKKRFHPTNISSPSSVNTTIVSAAMARLVPVSMEPALKVPQVAKTKTKTWVPTCPSSMPTICPKLTNITASVKKTSAFPSIVVSAAPPQKNQKYCNRPYLRGGTINNNNNNSEKKNLRGSF